jgi:flavin reductase (DIM6/NTAB) family NADH-FMN oxidoreductase RutF
VNAAVRDPAVEGSGNSPGVDRRTFFDIMSSFASGVAIITTVDGDGRPKGLTSSAVCSVSADPPLLLVCVGRDSRTLPALLERGEFVVNVLGRDRHALSTLFAGKGEDKFRDVSWRLAHNGMPWLHEDTVAHAACRTIEVIEAGDHVVLIGRVEGGGLSNAVNSPLVYFRRAYHGVHPA